MNLTPRKPLISIIVISYRMARELPRTLFSLTPQKQLGVSSEDYEVIVVDNGTPDFDPQSVCADSSNFQAWQVTDGGVSPCKAINTGLSMAKAPIMAVMIDGARICSPGLVWHSLKAQALDSKAVTGTMGMHIGPNLQMRSVLDGYNQATEDDLLESVRWSEDPYRLFQIAVPAGSCLDGLFLPFAESNSICMHATMWDKIGGFDEGFKTPGGGYANLDAWKRAIETEGAVPVHLLSEATFHQVHGGIATNSSASPTVPFREEYKRLRGAEFSVPEYTPLMFGRPDYRSRRILLEGIEKQASSKRNGHLPIAISPETLPPGSMPPGAA